MYLSRLISAVQSVILSLRSAIISFNIYLVATDRDIETKPNEVYGLVSGHTTGHHDREFYEAFIMMHIMHILKCHKGTFI